MNQVEMGTYSPVHKYLDSDTIVCQYPQIEVQTIFRPALIWGYLHILYMEWTGIRALKIVSVCKYLWIAL